MCIHCHIFWFEYWCTIIIFRFLTHVTSLLKSNSSSISLTASNLWSEQVWFSTKRGRDFVDEAPRAITHSSKIDRSIEEGSVIPLRLQYDRGFSVDRRSKWSICSFFWLIWKISQKKWPLAWWVWDYRTGKTFR